MMCTQDMSLHLLLLQALQCLKRLSKNNTLESVLEPLDGILLGNLVGVADAALSDLAAGDAGTGAGQTNEEVHAVNAGGGIVLDTKVDVLVDAEAEVAGLGEVLLEELVLLDLEATLEDLHGLLSADGDVARDLLVTADAEGTEGVAGLGVDGLLAGELLEHTGGAGETIAGLTDAAVQDHLVDLDLLHNVLLLVGHGCECFGV